MEENLEIQSNDPKFDKLLHEAKILKNAGKANKESSCWYYYGQEDSRLWWNKPYYEALLIKRELAKELIIELLEDHYLVRDMHRVNRISHAISDIDKMLSDNPKLPLYKLWWAQQKYSFMKRLKK